MAGSSRETLENPGGFLITDLKIEAFIFEVTEDHQVINVTIGEKHQVINRGDI